MRSNDEWVAREKELFRIIEERNLTIAALREKLKKKEKEIKDLENEIYCWASMPYE